MRSSVELCPPLPATTVTHITLSKKTTSKPSLEFYSDGSGEARRVTIEQFPFRIGRAETADLRVESVEVSREHAEIVERNGMWLVRDLGSTNGTQVNGKPIKETLLADGDILKVAETELTFIASAASQFQRMVTQPIQSKKSAAAPEFAAARDRRHADDDRGHALASDSDPIARGHVAAARRDRSLLRAGDRERAAAADCSTSRTRWASATASSSGCGRWSWRSSGPTRAACFSRVGAAEIESPHRLFSSLKQLQGLLPGGWELGITISLPTDVDILRITEVYREARDHELLVAFDEFQGNGGQVMHLESLLPDYLVLAANMTKDLTSTRQPLRRLESLLAACEELVIKPVLPRNDSGHALALCQEIGFDLVLQSATRRAAAPHRGAERLGLDCNWLFRVATSNS